MATDTTITRVEAWACSIPLSHPLSFGAFSISSREYVAIRVFTDGGLTADCLGLSRGAPIDVAVIDVLAPLLVGRDATAVAARLADLGAATRALDQEGVLGRARALIEIALWDLLAQEAGLPLWRLFGGYPRELPVVLVEGYSVPGESDDAFAERLAARVEEGYCALKIEAASYTDPRQLARRLEKFRALAGDEVELVIDMAWSWPNARAGLAAARSWSESGLGWIEDPMPRSRVRETVRLRSLVDSPIGAGDEATRPDELVALMSGNAIDVLRLDATAMGISAVRTLASHAESSGIRASLHVHPEVHQHLAFSSSAYDHVEAFPTDRGFDTAHQLLERSFVDDVRRGLAAPPLEAGSSLRLADTAVKQCAYRHADVVEK